MQRRYEQLTSRELAALAARPGSTVVWPMGSIEQHGPHLPLVTDALFADRVLDAVLAGLPEQAPMVRLPLQWLGFSPEHRGFAGTLTLPAELLISQIVAVGRQLADVGFERLVFFNGHGGQIALLQVAACQLRDHCPALAVLPCFLWSGPEGVAEQIPEPERSQGLHAGLAETSLMLHLAPELVGPERPHEIGAQEPGIQDAGVQKAGSGLQPPPGWSLEGAARCAWRTAELSHSGVIGDARGASAALGESLFERLVAGWRQRFEALLASSWPPTSRATPPADC